MLPRIYIKRIYIHIHALRGRFLCVCGRLIGIFNSRRSRDDYGQIMIAVSRFRGCVNTN